ncbi:MAG: ABC transporter substrate-binding protein, partial [Propionibacteriaceae bacterium]|nr:ABC transporter substrate-binding protein [Propionibacteriaceae bacterium]
MSSRAHTFGKSAAACLAAGALALGLAACSPPASSSPQASSTADGGKQVLNVVMSAGPGTLDPAQINQAAQWYADLAYAPIIQRSTIDGYRPSLATEWGYVGEGNQEFEFTLREGVLFADGSKLTASGVVDHL